jgi:HAE1 family hydrophobic/amphiphilic exporter-1
MGLGFYLFPIVGTEFMPKTEGREFTMDIKLEEGTRIERTESAVNTLETMIRSTLGDELQTIYTRIGPSSSGNDAESIFENENTAHMKILMKDDGRIPAGKAIDALGQVVANMSDMEVLFTEDETALQTTLGTDEAPVIVEVVGEEFDQIERIASEVEEIMKNNPYLFNIETSFQEGAPEVEVVVDRYRAGMYNLSVDQIISQIQEVLEGAEAGDFEHEGELKRIRIKVPEVEVDQLDDIVLQSGTAELRLSDVATIATISAPKEILRTNQNRVGKISAQFREGKPFNHIISDLDEELSEVSLPPRYSIRQAGQEQKRRDSMDNLRFALILSLILVYMVLASQFESLLHPFTIIMTVPMALVGSMVLFFILGKSLNIMAIIGIIMLIGIAVNNSIILVDFINQLKKSGMNTFDAVIQAGQHRIRPIIMTSLTTILALLPLTFGFGESEALRAPMALAVIGGLFTSTILTLIVIPCVYYVFDQLKEWVRPSETKE